MTRRRNCSNLSRARWRLSASRTISLRLRPERRQTSSSIGFRFSSSLTVTTSRFMSYNVTHEALFLPVAPPLPSADAFPNTKRPCYGSPISNSSGEAIPMRIHRLYTGTDGQSHLEELKIPFAPGGMGEQAPMQKAHGVVFSRVQPGAFMDWHNAPRRQFVITLQGAVEIGLGDGSIHRFGPGEGILAEDLTGKGHTTRAVGNEPRITIAIPLAD